MAETGGPRRTRGRAGQAALEAMMMMAFMLLLVFGVMHMTMFIVTRYMVNYAAFAAARAAEVGNDPEDAAAAREASTVEHRRVKNYVYRRQGQPCLVCGATVRTEELAHRNSFWCPRCQPVFRSRAVG